MDHMTTHTPQNLIDKAEAARRAGRGIRTVENWLRDGRLTKHKNGLGQVRVDADELDRLLAFVPVVASVNR